MLSYAVLIDGGFIRRKLGSREHPMTAPMLERFIEALHHVPALIAHRLHRVYFYDAAPFQSKQRNPLSNDTINFATSETALRSNQLHQSLQRTPFVAMRMGDLVLRGWEFQPGLLDGARGKTELVVAGHDLRPRIEQKGVDMRVGMDIAALTLKKIAQIIVLVTGDSDFVPAMKFARREGAQLYLVPMNNPIMQSMHEHSDLVLAVPGFPAT